MIFDSAVSGPIDEHRGPFWTIFAPNGQPLYEVATEKEAIIITKAYGKGWSYHENPSS